MLNVEAGAERAALVFAALGDPTRLALFASLSKGAPKSIAELTRHSSVSRQAVTKHLAVLEAVGLIDGERRGRENRFVLRRNGLDEAKLLLERVSNEWDGALQRLKEFVEE